MDLTQYTIIVRSVGERTTELSKALLSEVFPTQRVHVVNESPFTKAIEEMLRVGIHEGKKWILCIDADLLILKHGVLELLAKIEHEPENVFEFQGLVLDKLFGGPRPAGFHIYRTSLANKAITKIPSPEQSLRPETFMIKKMEEAGHPWKQYGDIVGLHDFEQYYSDIYKKAFVHSVKHEKYIKLLRFYWRRMAKVDKDFLVAIKALDASLEGNRKLTVDKNNSPTGFELVMKELGLKEKNVHIPRLDIDRTVEKYKVPYEFKLLQTILGRNDKTFSIWMRLKLEIFNLLKIKL